MLAHHLFNQSPFIQCVFSNLILAILAKVFDLSLIWIANAAEVLKVDINDEICWDLFIFVFSNVFRT